MENRINIGDLDTLVTLKSVTQTIGDQGQKTMSETTYGNVYAKIVREVDETVGDSNLEQGQNVTATIYKVSTLTTRWRVTIGSSTYEIKAIDPISRYSPLCTLSLHSING